MEICESQILNPFLVSAIYKQAKILKRSVGLHWILFEAQMWVHVLIGIDRRCCHNNKTSLFLLYFSYLKPLNKSADSISLQGNHCTRKQLDQYQ